MQTECSAKPNEFAPVEGRAVVAEFDGGALTSDAGGLLLGAAERSINLVSRLAECFRDARDPRFVEHSVAALVGTPSPAIPSKLTRRGTKSFWKAKVTATGSAYANEAPNSWPAKASATI